VKHLSTCQTSDGTGQGGNILSSGPVVPFCCKPTTSMQTETTTFCKQNKQRFRAMTQDAREQLKKRC